jgi:hypothetical protein
MWRYRAVTKHITRAFIRLPYIAHCVRSDDVGNKISYDDENATLQPFLNLLFRLYIWILHMDSVVGKHPDNF